MFRFAEGMYVNTNDIVMLRKYDDGDDPERPFVIILGLKNVKEHYVQSFTSKEQRNIAFADMVYNIEQETTFPRRVLENKLDRLEKRQERILRVINKIEKKLGE